MLSSCASRLARPCLTQGSSMLLRRTVTTTATASSNVGPQLLRVTARRLSTARPVRPTNITPAQRTALRKARKERATAALLQAQGSAAATQKQASSSGTSSFTSVLRHPKYSRWAWYIGVGVPTALLTWAIYDDSSPPAQFSQWIGLSAWIGQYTENISAPVYDKLLPDWADMPDMPQDIPVPHTLVLDLEKTLVSSSWDRKYGWRHAKRPGVDKFLRDMAQYYEIVLYSPSIDGVAIPVVESLDKDGYIRHRLFRDATHYYNGVHVKDLRRLNRNLNRMVVLDDDPAEVQFNPENLICVEPYEDPTDRNDDTLARITPFLIELARDNVADIPAILRQYRRADGTVRADDLAAEHERRLQALSQHRQTHGLGSLRRGPALPEPELPPALPSAGGSSGTPQLTARQIAGQEPLGGGPKLDVNAPGIMGMLNRRAKEKEEQQMRKMEKWQQVMMEKQKKQMEEQKAQAQ